MQISAKRPVRQALIVDSGLTANAGAAVRSVRALASELRSRGIEVIEAHSCEDGTATATSDASIDCILINWTQGANDKQVHAEATELMRAVRKRNTKLPIFLMASRKVAGTVSVEVAQLSDEFIWILEDTANFVAGRVRRRSSAIVASSCRPMRGLAEYAHASIRGRRPDTRAESPSPSSPPDARSSISSARILFRIDMGIERGVLGSLARPYRPRGGEREIRRARLRRPPQLFGRTGPRVRTAASCRPA